MRNRCLLPIAYCLLFLGFISLSFTASAQKEIPELWGHRVHDDAKVLSQSTIDYLEQTLKVFEDSTSNQIGILIVSSLEGEVIETFALHVAEKWKLGAKDKDNGIVLLVAIRDRKMRIEVGQGLEGPLPDAMCNRIIRNEMAPRYRRGDFDGGVVAAVDAIQKAIKGEYKADDRPLSRDNRRSGPLTGFFIFLVILILIIRNSRGNRGGRGGWSSGAGWFIVGSALGRGMGGGGGGSSSWGGGGGSFGGGGSSGSW